MLRSILRLPLTLTVNILVNLASMGIVLFGAVVVLGLETAKFCDKGLQLLEKSPPPTQNSQSSPTSQAINTKAEDSGWIVIPVPHADNQKRKSV